MAPGDSFAEDFRNAVMAPSFEKLSPEERIKTVLSVRAKNDTRFFSRVIEQCRLVECEQLSPTTVRAVFRFPVERMYCNISDNLQGGAQATIYDILSSTALQAIGKPNFWMNAGVSRTLNVTFLRPAPEGIDILCEVEVVQAGKALSLARGVMKRASDGALISTCEHNKAAIPSKDGLDRPKL